MSKPITDYEIICHGVFWPDYFQGCGIALTEFEDVATGIGGSEKEALDDALEMLAQCEWDMESNPELLADLEKADTTDLISEMEEEVKEVNGGEGYEELGEIPYVYVSVRVK